MPTNYSQAPSIARRVTVAALGLMIIAVTGSSNAGLAFVVSKNTPTGPSASRDIMTLRTSSGGQVARISETGQLSISGALKVQGVLISTGSALTIASLDTRYVNTFGDTMTGVLKVRSTVSGSIIRSDITLASSGALIVLGGGTIRGTLSGNNIHVEKTLSTSGSLIVRGTMSGSSTITGKFSPRSMIIELTASGTALTTGSGKLTVQIPRSLSGYTLSYFNATVDSAGTTGLTRIGMREIEKGKRQIFSTNPSIDSTEVSTTTAATPYVINASNARVGGGNHLSIDIPQIHSGTAPKGLDIELEFVYP